MCIYSHTACHYRYAKLTNPWRKSKRSRRGKIPGSILGLLKEPDRRRRRRRSGLQDEEAVVGRVVAALGKSGVLLSRDGLLEGGIVVITTSC